MKEVNIDLLKLIKLKVVFVEIVKTGTTFDLCRVDRNNRGVTFTYIRIPLSC